MLKSRSNTFKKMSNPARKILINTAAQVAAKILIGVLGIITLKILTTYLGRGGYGFYKSIYEFFALFAIVADMGLFTIGVREMSKDPKKESMVLGNLLSIRSLIIVIMVFMGVAASFLIPRYQDTIAPMAVFFVGIATVFAILTGTISTALQVHLKMEWNSIASVVGKVATLAYLLFVIFIWFPHTCDLDAIAFLSGSGSCAISDKSFIQLIFAGIFGNIIMFAITFWHTRKLVNIKYRFDFLFWKDVVWKALPYGLALVLNQIYFRIGSIMLFNMRGEDAVAIYTAPLTILEAAGIIPLYFMNSILPFLTRALQKKDGSHIKIIQHSFNFLMMSAMPIVAGTMVLAYQFIAIIATKEFLTDYSTGFYGSDIVLQILIIALFFSFLNGLFGYMLVASNNQGKLLWRNLVGAIITIILTWLLVPYWVERGAAFANMLTEFYIFVVSFWLAKKYVFFRLDLKIFYKSFLSAVIMAAVLIPIKDRVIMFFGADSLIRHFIGVIVLIIIGGIVYFVSLLLTKGLTKEMIDMVRKKKVIDSITAKNDFE